MPTSRTCCWRAAQHEIALRLCLGAGRLRLIRQLLTESALLALVGGVASLPIAYGIHQVLVEMVAQADQNFRMSFDLDPRILPFTLALSFVTTLVFGLLPALNLTKTDVAMNLKEQGRGAVGSMCGMSWGRILVGLQIALSLPLLLGAGLLLQSIANLENVDLGYSKENLLLLRIDAEASGYDESRRPPLYRELLERIRKSPGVKAATFSENGLFSGNNSEAMWRQCGIRRDLSISPRLAFR